VADRSLVLEALGSGLVQPDPTTCGSSVLVAARMLDDPAYAAAIMTGSPHLLGMLTTGSLPDRFRQQALAVHRRTSGFRDSRGGWQLPWPLALGTQPWALAREMTLGAGERGTRYVVHVILPTRRAVLFERVVLLAGAGHCVPLYVGNRWCPRHVVLVLPADTSAEHRVGVPDGARVDVYDPARGRCYPIDRAAFVAARLDAAGWRVPWLAVLPVPG
jgi:hypothetical protein